MAEPWTGIVASLSQQGIRFEPGLSDKEIKFIQRWYEIDFPPDFRAFLQTALPVGSDFPDWRNGNSNSLKTSLLWPADGICFDVQHNDLWFSELFGDRPTSLEAALKIVRRKVAEAPQLIPIYAHRFIPSKPHLPGNPVFSVYQTDIIYYGSDLADYLSNEFKIDNPSPRPEVERRIDFWEYFVS